MNEWIGHFVGGENIDRTSPPEPDRPRDKALGNEGGAALLPGLQKR